MENSDLKSILIVDDQIENLEAMVDILERDNLSCRITQAPSARIALMLIEKELPDLIITDWEMPEMNGIEFIKKLKANERTFDIPVIMCTGVMTSSENLETALRAGAIDYIRKPIDKIELIARTKANLHLSDSHKKIKKLNETKDKFFSIIAHDLKSPFNSMFGFLELLIEDFDDNTPDENKKLINFIYQSSQNAIKLVENLLEWSQTQNKTITFNPQKENLHSLLKETLAMLEQIINKKLIGIKNEIKDDFFIDVDRNMLLSVLRNLISNAVKFTPQKGEIVISAKKTEIENTRSFIEVSIKDNGVGMDAEKQTKVFNISENKSTQGTDNETGTGLGLILCKEFIEKHRGRIWVKSEEGKGSTFIFTIPAHEN